jgi:hypothetical protein
VNREDPTDYFSMGQIYRSLNQPQLAIRHFQLAADHTDSQDIARLALDAKHYVECQLKIDPLNLPVEESLSRRFAFEKQR